VEGEGDLHRSGGDGRCFHRIADLLERQADTIARLESQDNGRPIRETSARSGIVSRWYRYFDGWADKKGEMNVVTASIFSL
jgi:acyl-CoA reductase-like NAD-dependent aldehyde dehydrogenase